MQVVNVTTWDKNGFEPTQVLQRLSDLIWRGRVAGFTLLRVLITRLREVGTLFRFSLYHHWREHASILL